VSSEASLGWLAPEIQEELPHLRLLFNEAWLDGRSAPTGVSPAPVRERLASLSNRFDGAKAINLRREPIPAAYRVFYRHIGLDPDIARTPIEAAVAERMFDGEFVTRGLLADVLLIALLDTGIPVWAVDADTVTGELGIRMSIDGEAVGGEHQHVEGGRLVLADAVSALSLLLREPARGHRPHRHTRHLLLYSLQVEGVPLLALEEALWICRSALASMG
jgi:DNA/RNA-binding domain of Phe-tRNA-synthetase-like protein